MAPDEPTAQELVRRALDAHDVARKTSDPFQRAAWEQAATDLLQQAERAIVRQQGYELILGR